MSAEPTPASEPRPIQEAGATKSLQEMIAEQGVAETATFEHLLGSGADLWADDSEFDAFLAHLRAIRHEKG